MDTHIVVYLDILGFKAAVQGSDQNRIGKLITLLQQFAVLAGPFVFTEGVEQRFEGGRFQDMELRPEVSTFSDHVVLSFPKKTDVDHLLFALLLYTCQLAFEALVLGLLIRGGATVGPLFHAKGVVLGEALIDGYELESRVAVDPRIVVSHKLYSQLENPAIYTLTDRDGIHHLNYFRFLPTKGVIGSYDETWVAHLRSLVAENLQKLEEQDRLKEIAKWQWFSSTLEVVIASFQLKKDKELD